MSCVLFVRDADIRSFFNSDVLMSPLFCSVYNTRARRPFENGYDRFSEHDDFLSNAYRLNVDCNIFLGAGRQALGAGRRHWALRRAPGAGRWAPGAMQAPGAGRRAPSAGRRAPGAGRWAPGTG